MKKKFTISTKDKKEWTTFTDNLKNIKNKIQYMKILKLINQRKYLKSFFEIIKYPLGIKKLKLIVIFIVPDFILQYYRAYT